MQALLKTEKPFFAALGHAHSITLTDKYADQSFPTPSSLAESINLEAMRIKKAGEDRQRASMNFNNNKTLQKKLDAANYQLKTLSQDKADSLGSLAKSCLIGVVIGVACCLYFFNKS